MRCRWYNLQMNPLICAFGLLREILGVLCPQNLSRFCQHQGQPRYGTYHNLQTAKEFHREGLLRAQIYPDLSQAPRTIQPTLKRDTPFRWGEERQSAFQKVKSILGSPLTVISPVKGLPLTLHLIYTDKSMDALLV